MGGRRLSRRVGACLAVGLLSIAGPAVFSSAAFASPSNGTSNFTGHCDPSSPDCGANPIITGPPPPFVTVPSNCPSWFSTDAWSLDFVSGTSVFHFTSNNNGDWGTGTAQGAAVLTTSDGTVQYSGHVTEWFGGGNNKAGQTDGGFTLTFKGSGVSGNLSIHVEQGATTNNSGTPTANHTNVTVTCS